MREGWTRTTLGAVCELTKGTTPTMKARPGPYPLVVTAEARASSDEYQFDGEAICIPMVSSTGHGHASLKRVHYQSGQFAVANIITACTRKPDAPLDMRYLGMLLDHRRNELIVPLMKGTANVSLSQQALRSVPLTLPPVLEQRRIVDLISALDDAIKRVERQATEATESLTSLRRLLLQGSPDWKTTRLDSVSRPTTGRAFPARFQGDPTGDFPYIKCSDMNAAGQESIISSAANWINASTGDQIGAKVLPAGTVIFPILGAALATEKRRVLGRPSAFDQNVMGLEPGPAITSEFLLALMSEIHLARLSQQGAVPSVNQSIVGSIEVRLPTLDEQRRIGGLLSGWQAVIESAHRSAGDLRSLRGQVLTALLYGEHEIPASYDELLEVAS